MDENNIVIFAIKTKIIDILHYVIDVQLDIRLSNFLQEFYTSDNQLMVDHTSSTKELVFLNDIMIGVKLDDEQKEFKGRVDNKVINWMRRSFRDQSIDMKV
jgi:hypothetical protein